MKKLYLFRHGETEWNANRNIQYSREAHNSALNENGIKQSLENIEKLKDKELECVYSSNLKRAIQTATMLVDYLKIPLKIVDGLEEFSIYDDSLIGLTRNEILQIIGEDQYRVWKDDKNKLLNWRPFQCETKSEARKRIFSTIVNICKNTSFDIIGIASHGTILRQLLTILDFDNCSKLKNCENIEAEFDDDKIKIISRF